MMLGMVWTLLLLFCVGPTVQYLKQENILEKKINGIPCQEHSECRSHCCVRTSPNPQKFCSAKTIFMQCVAWRKPNGYYCDRHLECESLCCLSSETSSYHCVPRTGLLALCLPLWNERDRSLQDESHGQKSGTWLCVWALGSSRPHERSDCH